MITVVSWPLISGLRYYIMQIYKANKIVFLKYNKSDYNYILMKKSQRLQQTFKCFQLQQMSSSTFKENQSILSNLKNGNAYGNIYDNVYGNDQDNDYNNAYDEDQLQKLQNMLSKKPNFEEMMLLEKQKKQLQKIVKIHQQQEIINNQEKQQLRLKVRTLQKQNETARKIIKQLEGQITKFDQIRVNIVEEYQTLKQTICELNNQSVKKQNQSKKLVQKDKKQQNYAELKIQNFQLKNNLSKANNQINVLKRVILQLRSQIGDIKVQMFQIALEDKCKQFTVVQKQKHTQNSYVTSKETVEMKKTALKQHSKNKQRQKISSSFMPTRTSQNKKIRNRNLR